MSDLKRYHIIQQCIDVLKKRKSKVNYFEIGVQTGLCFFKIKADNKVAIDPNFIIKIKKRIEAYIRNPSNFNNRFFELTSDDFFEQQSNFIKSIGGIDVIFIDGLHLYEQVVTDIENSLKYLNEGGVILVHDCNPLTANAAVRAYTSEEVAAMNLPGYDYVWNGDVFKAITKLRSTRTDLKIAVLNTDHGIGIIQQGTPESILTLTPQQADELTYEELNKSRVTYLNLKEPEYFATFIKQFESAV